MTDNHHARDLFPLGQGQHQSRAASWGRTDPACCCQNRLYRRVVPIKQLGDLLRGTHPSASAPTSAPSGSPCNGSEVGPSSATPLLMAQAIVRCIHQLNPQSISARRESDPINKSCYPRYLCAALASDFGKSRTVGIRQACRFECRRALLVLAERFSPRSAPSPSWIAAKPA